MYYCGYLLVFGGAILAYITEIILCIEINKNLKFKKGVGIAIKSKETSSKLAI